MGPTLKEKQQWQAEDDARVMATYQQIMQDPARKNRAIKEANKQAANLEKRASEMRNAAGKSSKSKKR